MFFIWKRLLSKRVKQQAMVGWYNYLGRLKTGGEILFLNHGYDDPSTRRPEIPASLEKHRHAIQLYDLVASKVDFTARDVLEVSSGLGGGVEWIAEGLKPRSVTGLDLAKDAVTSCNARNSRANVRFVPGDAQAMPFEASSFDIVVNIESSLNYSDFRRFLHETARVLRPGGHFLFADYRRAKRAVEMQSALDSLGWQATYHADITDGIVRGLRQTNAAKREAVARHLPRVLRRTALHFAKLDTQCDAEAEAFRSGAKCYLALVLRKPEIEAGQALSMSAKVIENGTVRPVVAVA